MKDEASIYTSHLLGTEMRDKGIYKLTICIQLGNKSSQLFLYLPILAFNLQLDENFALNIVLM